MQEALGRPVSYKLRHLTAELRLLDNELKSNPSLYSSPDDPWLREFRHALDNIRLTAWSATELLDSRQDQKNLLAASSFLTVQRLRRFNQMAQNLCGDFDRDGVTWSVQAVKRLTECLDRLCVRLKIKN